MEQRLFTSKTPARDRTRPITVTGASSILVVFLVLCLVTFAALSLSTARSDVTYSERIAERRTAYYAACDTAQELCAAIDDRLAEAEEAGTEPELDPLGVEREGDRIFFTVPVDDTQELSVELELTEGEHYYRVAAWQLVDTADRTAAPLTLMQTGEGQ